jgi:hypothetical protein
MLYGEGSKVVQMEDLLDDLDSAIINEREVATRLITADEFYNEEDFTDNEQDDEDDENDDASTAPSLIPESLDRYRKDGPFGKLHNIGVHLRQSSQLQQAFQDAQQPCNTPLAWVHNVATRWSSDYAMAIRALQLRGPLTRLFADIESQGTAAATRRPGFLANKLEPGEWRVIEVLQQVLKHFDVICKQLQGDLVAAHDRSTCGRFDEYYPVIELFLKHLENAVQGFIIEDSGEGRNITSVRINIFEGMFLFFYTFTHHNMSFVF